MWKHTNESKEKIRCAAIGRTHSNETKYLIGQKLKGNKSNWKGGYYSNNIPTYDKYIDRISFVEKCRRNKHDKNILELKCAYCGNWFIPKLSDVDNRITAINTITGEYRLYCSNKCKRECPTYRQVKYPKGFKKASSREVQAELRIMRFEIDNYTCQKCNKHQDELKVGLHCHHIEGERWEPLESADIDKVITLCKSCHKKIHMKEGCKYFELQCREKNKKGI